MTLPELELKEVPLPSSRYLLTACACLARTGTVNMQSEQPCVIASLSYLQLPGAHFHSTQAPTSSLFLCAAERMRHLAAE